MGGVQVHTYLISNRRGLVQLGQPPLLNNMIEKVKIGNTWLLYFPEEDGGKFISVGNIASIVPNYSKGGSMIFLNCVDKAVAISMEPEEIAECLNSRTAKGNR